MKPEPESATAGPCILYSHHECRHVATEQCVAVHGLTYLLAGSLRVNQAASSHVFEAGSLLFSRKNFLAKFTKQPAANGPFQAITVLFDQALLREFSLLNSPDGVLLTDSLPPSLPSAPAVWAIPFTPALRRLYESLRPYCDGQPLPAALAREQQQEALRLLLLAQPALRPLLFDFGQPGKIDLEAFMRQHFRFKVELKQLAYLTGRSLAAFKRDFNQLFHTSPARWLYHQRLAEAYYLLQEEHQRPSDVYHAVGFESLAHLSHAFKQLFGRPPSSVHAPPPASAPPE